MWSLNDLGLVTVYGNKHLKNVVYVTNSTELVKKFLVYMEPDGSLQCSQYPATGHYPEPD
jgi:hypothetical protein